MSIKFLGVYELLLFSITNLYQTGGRSLRLKMNPSYVLSWREHCAISVSVITKHLFRLCCHLDVWMACNLKRDTGYFYTEEHWRFLLILLLRFCMTCGSSRHAVISHANNASSYHFRNIMSLTLFHGSTVCSSLHKFCVRVTFFLVFAKSPEESPVKQPLSCNSREVDGASESEQVIR